MARTRKKENKSKEENIELENIPLVGGFLKGLEKLVDLAERVERAGGEIKREGQIRGLGEKQGVKGIYGFSIRTGIGGQPQVQTFGNIRPTEKEVGKKEVRVTETREPIIDVFDEKDHILIIAELPGVSKESISLHIKGDILTLEAGGAKRRYEKEILLPAKVDFKSRKQKFNNGVLEIKMKKK